MIKKDIRDILIYLGLSIKPFLVHLLVNFLTLSCIMLVLFGLFITGFRFLTRFIPVILFLIAATLFYSLVRNTILLRQKWALALGFFRYLESDQQSPVPDHSEKVDPPSITLNGIRKRLKDVRAIMKKAGLTWISRDIVFSLAAGYPDRLDRILEKKTDLQVSWHQDSIRYLAVRILIFIFSLLPFALLSFLLTIGIHPRLSYMVYALGFLFAYFLYAAIFEPIFSLFICKKIFQGHSS